MKVLDDRFLSNSRIYCDSSTHTVPIYFWCKFYIHDSAPDFSFFLRDKKKLKPSMFTINSSTESNYIDCPFFLGSGVSWSLE
jgi:hypothetical protein